MALDPGEIRIFPVIDHRNRLFLRIVRERAGLLQPVVLFAHHLLLAVFGYQEATRDPFGSFRL
jgi:hypothetical protein